MNDCMVDPLGPVPAWNIVVLGDLNLMNNGRWPRAGSPRRPGHHGCSRSASPRCSRSTATRVDLAVGRDLNATQHPVSTKGSVTYGRDAQRQP